MFTATWLTIVKIWKQPKCPLTDAWIKKAWCIHSTSSWRVAHGPIERGAKGLACLPAELEGVLLEGWPKAGLQKFSRAPSEAPKGGSSTAQGKSRADFRGAAQSDLPCPLSHLPTFCSFNPRGHWLVGVGQEALGFQPKAGLSWKRGAALILSTFQNFGYHVRWDLLVTKMRHMLKLTTGLTTLE